MSDRDPVIIGGARTGIGRLLGSLSVSRAWPKRAKGEKSGVKPTPSQSRPPRMKAVLRLLIAFKLSAWRIVSGAQILSKPTTSSMGAR